jgi:hypothetical protein
VLYHDLRVDRNTIIKTGDVFVHQAKTAGRDRATVRARRIGAVDPIDGFADPLKSARGPSGSSGRPAKKRDGDG